MEYRNLGNSGLKVSPLCLGTMMFGDRTDYAESERMVKSARDAGVNFIDTADQYAKGESERIVGKIIKKDRADWVLATKFGNAMGEGPNEVGLSRGWMHKACDASLQRLGTDYIDLYYVHRDFADAALDEMVQAMGDLIRTGKVRYFALSNFRGWRISEVVWLCRQFGVPRPIACQPYYNAFNRMPEVEVLPVCEYHGLGVVPYSPIARGVLTGKYVPGEKPPGDTRAGRGDKRMMQTEFREESLVMAQTVKAHAEKKGITTGQFATAWVLANRIITSVIAGPRTLEQWVDYPKAVDYRWGADDEALIDSLVSPGHPSTPGYNDPQYPLIGRFLRG